MLIVMLNNVKMCNILLIVVMLSDPMLSVAMLRAIIPNVVLLSYV
jgi:hypothetical protein